MERHKAIIVGKREIYKDFYSNEPKSYLDYDNKFEIDIDKPPLTKGDSIFISKLSKIVEVLKVVRTDIENTVMYEVKGLYEPTYDMRYECEFKYYKSFNEKLCKTNISKELFKMLKQIQGDINIDRIRVNYEINELYITEYQTLKNFLNFDFIVVQVGFRYEPYVREYYDLIKIGSTEATLNNEREELELKLLSANGELQTIKRKWWYKMFGEKKGEVK